MGKRELLLIVGFVVVGAIVSTSPSIDLSAAGLIDASVSAPTTIGVAADVGHLDVNGLLQGLV